MLCSRFRGIADMAGLAAPSLVYRLTPNGHTQAVGRIMPTAARQCLVIGQFNRCLQRVHTALAFLGRQVRLEETRLIEKAHSRHE